MIFSPTPSLWSYPKDLHERSSDFGVVASSVINFGPFSVFGCGFVSRGLSESAAAALKQLPLYRPRCQHRCHPAVAVCFLHTYHITAKPANPFKEQVPTDPERHPCATVRSVSPLVDTTVLLVRLLVWLVS